MYEFDAIGTHWWLERLDGGQFTSDITDALMVYTAEFDQRYSRFRDDSLVAELARTGELTQPPKEMIDLLEAAREFSAQTDGTFSLLVGNALERAGYGQLASQAPTALELFWNKDHIVVPPGVVLDFGGLGKGWLIDEYVKILRRHGVAQFIVNGGGDLYVWSDEFVECALEDPFDSSKMIGTVNIKRGALAASSTVKRAWETYAGMQHHIIDPKTGKPSESEVVASFVTAETALVADVLATVLIIRPELNETLRRHYKIQTKMVKRR